MGKNQLGEFEEIVMLTVGVLYGDAYGVSIKKEIESRLERKVSVGALQSALVRLENKNFLISKEGGNTSARGGRPKRYFTITALGKQAIQQTRDMRNQLYSAIPEIALDVRFS
ncbi:MAG: helix-turn-helix transcriptional regulator [Reichenbachiella sp.]|uniref:PadR family transcriptional regulator n=1 Tax=Reichenbachiella sp. TaxID=2184521 RepID=UPI0032661A43